jgi:hypothetical protein
MISKFYLNLFAFLRGRMGQGQRGQELQAMDRWASVVVGVVGARKEATAVWRRARKRAQSWRWSFVRDIAHRYHGIIYHLNNTSPLHLNISIPVSGSDPCDT